ncbi:MAG: hypothetical protein IVW51_05130 [Thermaceae bacterium]|nr:hypothetical protein [Thermaceae bacterium]
MLVGYFYGLDHHNQISNIPASGLSTVLYAFVNVSSTGECVSADSNSSAEQTNSGTWQRGAIRYGDLEKYYGSYSRYWQSETLEPWLYSPSSGIFITYEDLDSVAAKADYVVAHGLGGIMVWHLSDDDAQHSLINALLAHLQGP